MLEQLVGAYQATGDTAKTYDAAKRLLQVDPNNLRALIFVVYVEKQQAQVEIRPSWTRRLHWRNAASDATKPASMSDADFQKLKDLAAPIFANVIGADAVAKKDYKTAITVYTAELHAAKDPAQTTQGLTLADTYALGNAYVQQEPKDLVKGIWFLTRAAQYLQEPYKSNVEKAAEYWYKKYHGSMDGFDQIKQLAHDNVFPPDSYQACSRSSSSVAQGSGPQRACEHPRSFEACFGRQGVHPGQWYS